MYNYYTKNGILQIGKGRDLYTKSSFFYRCIKSNLLRTKLEYITCYYKELFLIFTLNIELTLI